MTESYQDINARTIDGRVEQGREGHLFVRGICPGEGRVADAAHAQ